MFWEMFACTAIQQARLVIVSSLASLPPIPALCCFDQLNASWKTSHFTFTCLPSAVVQSRTRVKTRSGSRTLLRSAVPLREILRDGLLCHAPVPSTRFSAIVSSPSSNAFITHTAPTALSTLTTFASFSAATAAALAPATADIAAVSAAAATAAAATATADVTRAASSANTATAPQLLHACAMSMSSRSAPSNPLHIPHPLQTLQAGLPGRGSASLPLSSIRPSASHRHQACMESSQEQLGYLSLSDPGVRPLAVHARVPFVGALWQQRLGPALSASHAAQSERRSLDETPRHEQPCRLEPAEEEELFPTLSRPGRRVGEETSGVRSVQVVDMDAVPSATLPSSNRRCVLVPHSSTCSRWVLFITLYLDTTISLHGKLFATW